MSRVRIEVQEHQRYLNIHKRELHRVMQRFEETRQTEASVAQTLHKETESTPAVVQEPHEARSRKSQVT